MTTTDTEQDKPADELQQHQCQQQRHLKQQQQYQLRRHRENSEESHESDSSRSSDCSSSSGVEDDDQNGDDDEEDELDDDDTESVFDYGTNSIVVADDRSTNVPKATETAMVAASANDTFLGEESGGYAAATAAGATFTASASKLSSQLSHNVKCDYLTLSAASAGGATGEGAGVGQASLERCYGIRKLLEEQHRKWWPRLLQQQQQKHSKGSVINYEAPPALQDWWADQDGYNLAAFKQINGNWPRGHPLPLPDWGSTDNEHSKGILTFDSVWQYEDFNAIVETKMHRLLEETHYDTVNLFVEFYRAFKRTRRSDLKSFFQFYDIPINRRHHMCVSLAMEIMTRLIEEFPILEHYLYLVSCEEQVVSLSEYLETIDEVGGLNAEHANVEKEHAMVAMKIMIGDREGCIILDPGYHVARVVTVMKDQKYPHTGWFTQSREAHIQRDYCYAYSRHDQKYVEWMEREIRGDKASHKTSLVYVEQPYVTAIDVTVRRNLVYNFRSLLARDAKGRVFAGIYLPVLPNCHESHFTIFYDGDGDKRVKVKFLFSALKNQHIPDIIQQHLDKLAPQLNINLEDLSDLCKSLTEVVLDQDFITQLLAINDDIGNMSAEN